MLLAQVIQVAHGHPGDGGATAVVHLVFKVGQGIRPLSGILVSSSQPPSSEERQQRHNSQ